MTRAVAPVVFVCALLGAVGAVIALNGRGASQLNAEEGRSLASEPLREVSAASLAALVGRAPEPVSVARRTPVAAVRCLPGGEAGLRNPWSCRIGYRSGTLARYRVFVRPDGRYEGVGSGIIEGCCVKTPQFG